MSLLTIGTVAFDTIETPFGKAEMVIGGACTYISWSASYFVPKIYLVSIVGDDFPKEDLAKMEDRGINMDGLEIVKGGKSFFWAGRYHDDMIKRDTLVTDLNVLADFQPKVPQSARSCKYVMLGNLTPNIQSSVIDQLDGSQKIICLDTMNFWMDIAMDELKAVIQRIHILTINDDEARQLSGKYSLKDAARAILEMGPEFLIIKKGEHGALLFHKDNMFYAPALPLPRVVDPTGAGDTFAGGLMGYLTATDDISFDNMKRAIIAGSAMASFCVEDFSLNNIQSLDNETINKRMQEFKVLTHFDLEYRI
jgi:sugar/nucleoside kinase (ribokinase family)